MADELHRLDALQTYYSERVARHLDWAGRVTGGSRVRKRVRRLRERLQKVLNAIMAYSAAPALPYDSTEAQRQLAAAAAEILAEKRGGQKARAA